MAAELSEMEDDLCRFAWRLEKLCNLDAELLRVTRGKKFLPSWWEWDKLLSERDMLIIELASWARAFYGKGCGGFLRSLEGEDLRALAFAWNGDVTEWRKAAFDRLFPGADGWPRPSNIAALCERLHERFGPLLDDRDNYRAHRYERRQKTVTAKQLALEDVVAHLKTCQELLGDLRCLSSNESFAHWEVHPEREDSDAQSAVDMLFCRTVSWLVDFGPGRWRADLPRYEQRRSDFYDRMHAAHEAAGAPDIAFNDGRFQPDLTRL
jgi:hypothetical protein